MKLEKNMDKGKIILFKIIGRIHLKTGDFEKGVQKH